MSESEGDKGNDNSNKQDGAIVREEYDQLCSELNMDESTTEAAWNSYMAIKHNYTLEGNQLHWLACALHVACHNSPLPTVGEANVTVEGNGVSLTRLLRSCKLGLPVFFNKAKKWADMSNMKKEFRIKIDRLERNYSVSNVIYKKFKNIYKDLFKDPVDDPPKITRSRKQKKPPCTSSELYDFCWTLYVRVKADYHAISDDLVNSYHLLLSCVDFMYSNVILGKRNDLLKEESGVHRENSSEPPCILDWLSTRHDGIIGEVRSIREHWWRPQIKKFFERKLLKGSINTLSGLLDISTFELNSKAVRKDYEAVVLSIGEFDERVFLDSMASLEIGTPSKAGPDQSSHEAIGDAISSSAARRNLNFGNFLVPSTPLSGKQYLRAQEQLKVTPVSQATLLVSRLTRLLANREAGPTQKLKDIFQSCKADPTESISRRVKEMGETFCLHYVTPTESHPGSHETFARKRLHMAEILYYKLLETILLSEKAKNKPYDNILTQDLFHQALFTCCLEIVIFSYNSQRIFPWVLNTFKLEAVHFYKVIEVIIRHEDWLPRDVVKHLQRIEEQVLESRAWSKESSLWELINHDPLGVPSCEEVSLPHHQVARSTFDITQSPLSHHERAFSVMRSPLVADRFKSPVVTAVARRQLSFDTAPTSPIRAGQSLLSSPQRPIMTAHGIALVPHGQQSNEVSIEGSSTTCRKASSLVLFFRKFYHLANLRLDLLCHTLEIMEEDVRRKIWTVFEHSIRQHTTLMKDRHLDQIIMCSLYIVCKVVGKNINFTDIMKHYRSQPQAASHVYRSVLLSSRESVTSSMGEATKEKQTPAASGRQSPPPTPTRPAATSTIIDGEERGDLILFYNKVFMDMLQAFALKFKRTRQATETAPPLSPLPKLRAHPQSPCRKISDSHSVFIRPLKTIPGDQVIYNPQSPHKPLSYSFSRSPAKDLAAINALMRIEVERKSNVGKRLLAEDINLEADEHSPKKLKVIMANPSSGGLPVSTKVNTKLELIISERSQAD